MGNTAANRGGGIFNRVDVRLAAGVTLTNSTVSGNSARSGGGIFNSGFLGPANVARTSSTVARNSATLRMCSLISRSVSLVRASA